MSLSFPATLTRSHQIAKSTRHQLCLRYTNKKDSEASQTMYKRQCRYRVPRFELRWQETFKSPTSLWNTTSKLHYQEPIMSPKPYAGHKVDTSAHFIALLASDAIATLTHPSNQHVQDLTNLHVFSSFSQHCR